MKSKFLLTMKVWREGKYYVAYNPELDVASQGKTEAQAQDNLKEALELFLETTKKWGLFHRFCRFNNSRVLLFCC